MAPLEGTHVAALGQHTAILAEEVGANLSEHGVKPTKKPSTSSKEPQRKGRSLLRAPSPPFSTEAARSKPQWAVLWGWHPDEAGGGEPRLSQSRVHPHPCHPTDWGPTFYFLFWGWLKDMHRVLGHHWELVSAALEPRRAQLP